ncbi:MAG: phosphoribosylformimino-5-aminoimidazole carboxamide ribotide isomerase [Desulfobacteraceae bacterium]|nr:phosphoribosylformimino-5-aminoimidazole carboxamide ribotide isomerase [Desulfobacteraceae bacterium]
MKFRPCIDLHDGKVKQIVGSSLNDQKQTDLKENFVSRQPPSYYAALFRQDRLTGGHVIMLGPGNEQAALDAIHAWPGGLQIGGGITAENAGYWLDQGAEAVIITSYVFKDGRIHKKRLKKISSLTGRNRLVLDLSCRWRKDGYYIVTERWQRFTDTKITPDTLRYLADFSFEFLIHAVDVEGKCSGIEKGLAELLGRISPVPATYAGGASSLEDVYLVKRLGQDRLDITIGSALDIFGGTGVKYEDMVGFNRSEGH